MSKISVIYAIYTTLVINKANPIDSVYYYPSDFRKLKLSSSSTYVSLFHINLNSLDAPLDDLTTLASLNFSFHVIGIS